MTNEEAIRALIAHGHNAELQSLVSSGFDDENGSGATYLKAQSRRADDTKTTTQRAGDDPSLQKIMKGRHDMDVTESALLGFAKGLLAGDSAYGLKRQDFEAGIATIAKRIQQPGETSAQSFTKAMVDTEAGRLLFAASKRAPSAPPDPDQDDVDEPEIKGEATLEIERRAREHLKAHPELSKDNNGRPKRDGGFASAYTAVFEQAERSLRQRVKQEAVAGVPRTPPGRRLPYEDPNRNAAVRAAALRSRGP